MSTNHSTLTLTHTFEYFFINIKKSSEHGDIDYYRSGIFFLRGIYELNEHRVFIFHNVTQMYLNKQRDNEMRLESKLILTVNLYYFIHVYLSIYQFIYSIVVLTKL